MIVVAQNVEAISAGPDVPRIGTSRRIRYQWVGMPGIGDGMARAARANAVLAGPIFAPYTLVVAETTATRIGVRNCTGGQPPFGGIFSSTHQAPSMVGPWWGCARARRFPVRRYANPAMCPATLIGVRDRVSKPCTGGRIMRSAIPARPEQAPSPIQCHPLFGNAGAEASALWLKFAPLTAAEFRNMVAGHLYLPDFRHCRDAFNDAVAAHIASGITMLSSEGVRA